MPPEQFQTQLLAALNRLAEGLSAKDSYTLTGAADWPLLAFMCGILFVFIGFMWLDLRRSISAQDDSLGKKLDAEINDRKEGDNHIWQAMRDCREECHDQPKKREPGR